MLILKILIIVVAVLALIALLSVGLTFYWLHTKQSWREIARNVLVSPDWLDITPQPPLKVKLDIQHVFLAIEGYKYKLGSPLTPIRLADGTMVNPEIQIFDEHGRVYDLKGLTVIGNHVGFSTRLPRDKVYTGVKIRSEQSFTCSGVYWECTRMK